MGEPVSPAPPSTRRSWMEKIAVVVAAVVLLTGADLLGAARERAFPAADIDESVVYITSASAVRRLTTSFNTLAADLYWIRALQYYGGAKRRLEASNGLPPPPPLLAASTDYDQLYPLLDIATTLDPRFAVAYRFGAIFLAEAYPSGYGRPDLAVKLLEKGIREQPDKWEYMEDVGFVYYWYEHNYRDAASWFERAGRVPGAPNWLQPLAATTLAQGGDRDSSRLMWTAILQGSDQDWLRRSAEQRLLQLRALDEIDALQKRVDAYAAREGEKPSGWEALVRARAIPGIPLDPTRQPYELTPEGRVTLSTASSLNPLPAEPTAVPPS